MFQKICITLAAALLCLYGSSCIKEEAKNMEADIIAVPIADSLVYGSPRITNNFVVIHPHKDKVNIDSFPLFFELTPGAKISPASGSYQNFSAPVTYTVTSEDGQYQKTYQVAFITESVPTTFDFEHYEFDALKAYTKFFEVGNTQANIWGSGNAGFATLAGSNPTASSYPTQVTTLQQEVQHGLAALKLVTTSTGALGAMVNMPIAAGSLFIGSLDISNQFNPQTQMGFPYSGKPLSISGYYQYKPGDQLIDKSGSAIEGSDECSIYAVLYDRNELFNRTQTSWLSNDNVQTDPSIVAIAKLPSGKETEGNQWIPFHLTFDYLRQVDLESANAFNYNITIVFSSSKDGDSYQGAVGSTLLVDHVTIQNAN